MCEARKQTVSPLPGVSRRYLLLCGSLLAILGASIYLGSNSVPYPSLELGIFQGRPEVQLCPQASELFPIRNRKVWVSIDETLNSQAFEEEVVEWLSGAIRVP